MTRTLHLTAHGAAANSAAANSAFNLGSDSRLVSDNSFPPVGRSLQPVPNDEQLLG
jgi:hypothetical protein